MDRKYGILIAIILILLGALHMPDAPDGYRYQPYSNRAVLADMAELAARLRSPVVHDRRGTVVFIDDMGTGGSAWSRTGSGTGNEVKVSTLKSSLGGYVLHMIAGSDASHASQIYTTTSLPRQNKWGIAILFAVTVDYEYLSFSIATYDGTNRVQGRIKILDADNKIYYRDSAGNDQEIATLDELTDAYGVYHWLKLVVDFDTGKYVRVLFDDAEHDLSAYTLYTSLSSEVAQSRSYITISGRNGENDPMYVDAVIFTIDEP